MLALRVVPIPSPSLNTAFDANGVVNFGTRPASSKP